MQKKNLTEVWNSTNNTQKVKVNTTRVKNSSSVANKTVSANVSSSTPKKLSKKEKAMEEAKLKDRFAMKPLDTDKSFKAVELVVPEEYIKQDKEL